MATQLALIVAVSENGIIGRDGDLPWRLPGDLEFFKRSTMGHHIIMGRKTHESMKRRVLPGRPNLVLTRDKSYQAAPGAIVLHQLDDAIALARAAGDELPFIIGGAQLYAQALPQVTRMVMTVVHADIEGDTRFPWIVPSAWEVQEREGHEADAKNPHSYEFVTMTRCGHH